jgi:Predicted pPIWI-associating nuclease
MARRPTAVVVATPNENLILETLLRILPAADRSYEQCLLDFGGVTRRSYRGVAHELREVLRETLNYLAPDGEVMADPGFRLEDNAIRPTQRQKAVYIFRKRRLSREQMSAPELTISMIEGLGAQITRTAYTRGAKHAHTVSSEGEVRQLKMYVDAVLGELLEIHAQSPKT